jgi:multiple sugar transport system permease protein
MAETIAEARRPSRITTLQDKKREETLTAYGFMAPAIIVFMVFLVIPIIFSLYISFTDWNGITPLNRANPYNVIGLENYNKILFEAGPFQSDFYKSVKNTIYYVLGVVPAQTILALVLAVIVNQRWLKAKGFFRTAFYFPSITSSVVISLIFMWMFTRGGLINNFVAAVFPGYTKVNWLDNSDGLITNLLGLLGVNLRNAGDWARVSVGGLRMWDWISGPSVTMFTIMLLNTWTTIGTMMVIYLAALQNIPSHVYEAAVVDGATA